MVSHSIQDVHAAIVIGPAAIVENTARGKWLV